MSLQKLKSDCPYPSIKPTVPPNPHGWFAEPNERLLRENVSADTKLVIEVGSWLGMSLRHILKHAPNATVIAVDTWAGSEEHFKEEAIAALLPTLFDTWVVNQWDYRDRLIPMRMDSALALYALAEYDIQPDLIYIDAAHDYDSVKAEVEICLKAWPNTIIVGDDWNWGNCEVNKAVEEVMASNGKTFTADGNCWLYKP